MRIPIDRQSSTPLYQQIEQYVRQNIASGALEPETRLPAARELAHDLGISRITVENAYATLESQGLVERRAGSGTFVAAPGVMLHTTHHADQWPLWQHDLHATAPMPTQSTTTTHKVHPAPISFTGFGDPRRFPIKDMYRAFNQVMQRDGITALGMEDSKGYEPLRATIAQILTRQGIQAHARDVLITSGSQQALALIVQTLLKPGDAVVVEQPTYDRALNLFRSHQLKIVGCPVDEAGMQVEQLEALLQRHHPRLIYTIPNFQNPTGTCLSTARRKLLVALAARYNIAVVEDDFVGELRYEGQLQPALKALAPDGHVIYIGTFSKLLMPGLRVGFLVAEGPISDLLADRKQVNDLATATLVQRALDVYVTVGRYQAHVRRSCQVYRRRRDAMVQALAHYLPQGVTLIPPHGGLFVWLELPEGASATARLALASEEGVEYAPGSRFFPNPHDGERHLRLNFATQTPDEIEEGASRLGRALQRLIRNPLAQSLIPRPQPRNPSP